MWIIVPVPQIKDELDNGIPKNTHKAFLFF